MTDQIQQSSHETVISSPENNSVATSTAPEAPEKLVPQSRVNEIVKERMEAARKDGYEKGRTEASTEHQMSANLQQPYVSVNNQQTQIPYQQKTLETQGYGQQQAPSPAQTVNSQQEIQRLIDEGVSRKMAEQQQAYMDNQRQAEIQQSINTFASRVGGAYQSDPEFARTVDSLQLQKPENLNLIRLANLVDNPIDVLKEFKSNPSHIAGLGYLANTNPQMAIEAMHKLSNSIKTNQTATIQKQANAPLSQITPSTVTTDNGDRTVSDLRKASYLRA